MKSARGLEILTPADGIAALLNEPLEKIEAMIAVGNCPTPVFREGMSQPRWRDADIQLGYVYSAGTGCHTTATLSPSGRFSPGHGCAERNAET